MNMFWCKSQYRIAKKNVLGVAMGAGMRRGECHSKIKYKYVSDLVWRGYGSIVSQKSAL